MSVASIECYDPRMIVDSCSAIGGRSNQEDSFLVYPERRVFAVADGMGGHERGEVASRAAVEALRDVFGKSDLDRTGLVKRTLELATIEANQRVLDLGRSDERRPGTTLTALAFELGWGSSAWRGYVAHSGDSRCYLLRENRLHQLTKDHAYGNSLYKCLGNTSEDFADCIGFSWRPGDSFLLCSDGIHNVLPDGIIAWGMAQSNPAKILVRAALDAKTSDNCTCVCVRV